MRTHPESNRRSRSWPTAAVVLLTAVCASCGADQPDGRSAGAAGPAVTPAATDTIVDAPPATAATTEPVTAAAERPTKPQYIQAAEALCERHHVANEQRVKQWKLDHDLNPNDFAPPELQEPLQKELIVPDVISEFNELRALTRPAGDEETLQRWFDAFDKMLPAWKESPTDDDQWVEVNAISQAYGINPDVC